MNELPEQELGNIEELLRIAKKYEEEGRLKEAAVLYDQALIIDPDNREAKEGLKRIRKIGYIMRDTMHKGCIVSVDWSPEGRYVLSACREGVINIWDARSGKLVREYKTPLVVQVVSWSPDGQYIAVGEEDKGIVEIWHTFTGQIVWRFRYGSSLKALSWSPDGRYIAVGGLLNEIHVFDLNRREKVAEFRCPDFAEIEDQDFGTYGFWEEYPEECTVFAIAWSPDGKYIIGRFEDGRFRVWNFEKREFVGRFEDELWSEYGIDWSPDGKYLATCAEKDKVAIWVAKKIKLWRVIRCGDTALTVKWSPDGKLLACGLANGTVEIWDPRWKKLVKVLEIRERDRQVISVSWSPDGKRVACGDGGGGIKICNLETRESISLCTREGHDEIVWTAIPSPGNKYIASELWHSSIIKIWRWGRWEEVMSIKCVCCLSDQAWDPSDDLLVGVSTRDGVARIWSIKEEGEIAIFARRKYEDAYWHPRKRYIALKRKDGVVEIWDFENLELIKVMSEPIMWMIRWISDGRYIVGRRKDSLVIWDFESGEIVADVTIRETFCCPFCSSRGSVVIFKESGEKGEEKVYLWDWRRNYVSTISLGEHVGLLDLSPDDRYLAYRPSRHSIGVWDIRNNSLKAIIENFDFEVVESFLWREPDRIFVATMHGDFFYLYPFA